MNCLFFICFLELQAPTITPAFSSPLHVVEGESVSVEWNYSLHGVGFLQTRFSIQGAGLVVLKIQTSAALISTSFRGRITENITESFASITFLSVNRTDSKAYTLAVTNVNGDDNVDTVEIQVQCKLWNYLYLPTITLLMTGNAPIKKCRLWECKRVKNDIESLSIKKWWFWRNSLLKTRNFTKTVWFVH